MHLYLFILLVRVSIFLPFYCWYSHCLNGIFGWNEILNLNVSHFTSYFLFMITDFGIKITLLITRSSIYCLISFIKYYCIYFTFSSVIHLKLMTVHSLNLDSVSFPIISAHSSPMIISEALIFLIAFLNYVSTAICILKLILKIMVLLGGALRRWLDHEGRDLTRGVSVLIRRAS